MPSALHRLLHCCLLSGVAGSALAAYRGPNDRTVYDDWIADSQYRRAEEQRSKDWAKRSAQSGYGDHLADLQALNAQSRLQAQWAAEEAAEAARRARRAALAAAREAEQRALLALYNSADAGNADALIQLGQRDEASAFGKWGIPRYQMVFGPRRTEALWRIVALLRTHANEPEQLTSFRPVESFLAELAARGDVRAAREAGQFWLEHDDPFRAAAFFAQASEKGDVSAQRSVLHLLATDRIDGLPTDESQVLAWSREAAVRNELDGQYWLGRGLSTGAGAARDAAAGLGWLRKAAANQTTGADAENTLVRRRAAELAGLMLRDGAGIPADVTTAISLLTQAAQSGSDSAMLALGQTYLLGLGVAPDQAQGTRWLRAAAEKENAAAAALLATALLRPDASDEEVLDGLVWLRQAAKRRPEAMLLYGRILFAGDYGVDSDTEEALRLFGTAIQRYPRDPGVLDFVGSAYLQGTYGLSANPAEGVRLLKQAAEAGSIRAALRLEAAYRDGVGVPRDASEATRWGNRARGS